MNEHVNEWMLEADVGELRNPPAQIAQHLDTCLNCRVALQRITAGYAELDRGLDALAAPTHKRRPWLWVPVPLAAAAVIALLWLPHSETPPPPPTLLAKLMFREQPVVIPERGQQAIVMGKGEMTVVWLTNHKGQP